MGAACFNRLLIDDKIAIKKLFKKAQNVTATYNTVANKRLMLQKDINDLFNDDLLHTVVKQTF